VKTGAQAVRRFQAMGCRSTIVVEGADGEALAELAMIRIARLEACWSRFLPDSDVSRLNRAGGRAILVRPDTVRLLQAMAEATAVTAGAYDPTVLGPRIEPSRWSDAVAVDTDVGAVQVRAGITIDPGGIGKGLAADIVADQVIAAGAAAVAAMIGGDGRVRSIDGTRRWTIDIAAPDGSAMIDRVEVDDAAVATSGYRLAHLVDPSTGELCEPGDVIQASVLAGTGASAEALTKAVIVGGDPYIADDLDRQGIGVLAVHADGRLSANRTWRRHRCRPEPVSHVDRCERPSASEGAVSGGLRGRGTRLTA
jgi:FAD:protein FMN transferase